MVPACAIYNPIYRHYSGHRHYQAIDSSLHLVESSSRAKRFHRHYREQWHYPTGTIAAILLLLSVAPAEATAY